MKKLLLILWGIAAAPVIAGDVASTQSVDVKSKRDFFESLSQQNLPTRPNNPQPAPTKGKEKEQGQVSRPPITKTPWEKNPIMPVIPEVKVSFDFQRALNQGDEREKKRAAKELNAEAIFWLLKDSGIINSTARKTHLYSVEGRGKGKELDGMISVEKLSSATGAFTQYIYKVHIPAQFSFSKANQNLIVKGVKWLSTEKIDNRLQQTPIMELQSLEYLRESSLGKLEAEHIPYMPVLAIPLKNFYYQFPPSFEDNKVETQKRPSDPRFSAPDKYYVSISRIAEGKSAFDLMSAAGFEVRPNLEAAFYDIGKSLGTFHFQLARPDQKENILARDFDNFLTIRHGDFHSGNVFYNSDNGKVTFIDLASMAESHRSPVPFWHDLYRFYVDSKYLQWSQRSPVNGFNELMLIFLEGYAEGHPDEIREDLKVYLKGMLGQWTQSIFDLLEYRDQQGINFFRVLGELITKVSANPVKFQHNPDEFPIYIVQNMRGTNLEAFKGDTFSPANIMDLKPGG